MFGTHSKRHHIASFAVISIFIFWLSLCILAQIKSEKKKKKKKKYLSSFNAPLVPDLVFYCLIYVP